MSQPELKPPMDRRTRFNIWFWAAAFFMMMGFHSLYSAYTQVEPLPYSEFQRHLREGRVEEVAISDRDIRGELKQPLPTGERYFVTTRVDPEIAQDLDRYDVPYSG